MPRILTDTEIRGLLTEPKPLPANWRTRLKPRPKSGGSFRQRDVEVNGISGHRFRVILRQNDLSPLDFSIILIFVDQDSSEYRLIRFNGRHPSQHTNKWEKMNGVKNCSFRNRFHMHQATERYQLSGLEADGYAEPTDKYGSFDEALETFVQSYGLMPPASDAGDGPMLWDVTEGEQP